MSNFLKKSVNFLLFALLLSLANPIKSHAEKIEGLRTDLYSKIFPNTLKKIELSLDFEGINASKSKLKDATNVVASSFFYEDLFTEAGKAKFKQVLARVLSEKYGLNPQNIYILTLKSIEKFDINEFREFLKDADDYKKGQIKRFLEQNSSQNLKNQAPKTQNLALNLQNSQQNSRNFLQNDIKNSQNLALNFQNLPNFQDDFSKLLMNDLAQTQTSQNAYLQGLNPLLNGINLLLNDTSNSETLSNQSLLKAQDINTLNAQNALKALNINNLQNQTNTNPQNIGDIKIQNSLEVPNIDTKSLQIPNIPHYKEPDNKTLRLKDANITLGKNP